MNEYYMLPSNLLTRDLSVASSRVAQWEPGYSVRTGVIFTVIFAGDILDSCGKS